MQEHSRKPLDNSHVIGGYNIVRMIGQGGFGIVYEALNHVTGQRVAIKQFYPQDIATWRHGTIIVNRDDDKEFVNKILTSFEIEARLQYTFKHPNILEVLNFIRADNTGYMISSYIDGSNLIQFLAPYGSAFPDEAMFRRVLQPIVEAVGYVHGERARHGDISPENIMIDRFGKPVLIDFGAARQELQRTVSTVLGRQFREAYAPVEQQVPSDERPEGNYTDIFALAGTMYRLLAGIPPRNPVERSLANRDPYVPIAQAARIPCSKAVYDAIDRGLMREARDRPASIEEFARLLGWSLKPLVGTPQPPVEPPKPPVEPPKPPVEPPRPPVEPTKPPGEPTKRPVEPPDHPPRPKWIAYVGLVALVAALGSALFLIDPNSHPDPTPAPTSSPVPTYNAVRDPPSFPATPPPSTFTPRPPPAPTYVTYENRDIDGGDLPGTLPHLSGVDQASCLSACNNTSGCIGFSYGKWDRACYLKQSLPDLRFEPNSTAVFKSGRQVPPNFGAPRKMERATRIFDGSRYSTSSASSRQACSDLCEAETSCLGYQYTGGSCWRYDRIDSATKDPSAQSGVKRQPAPP
jgi:serine/threonine protein kinase